MPSKKRAGNKKDKQSNFAKLSIFQKKMSMKKKIIKKNLKEINYAIKKKSWK